jgi:replicative DNA helicase
MCDLYRSESSSFTVVFPGKGKTQSLVRSSIPAYAAGDVVLMNSLEMGPHEIWEIYDAEAARISRRAIRHRELGDGDYKAYEEAAARVRTARNDIIYTRVETVDKLAALAERYGAKTVCVDYVSLMESQRRASSDWERVKDVSQSLKKMAGDMGVRVYAAAQNSKDAALNGPTEDNIAYSSAIFYDCNVMIGLAPDRRVGQPRQSASALDQEPRWGQRYSRRVGLFLVL